MFPLCCVYKSTYSLKKKNISALYTIILSLVYLHKKDMYELLEGRHNETVISERTKILQLVKSINQVSFLTGA